MSRLYISLQQRLGNEMLTPAMMKELLQGFVESHRNISDSAFLKIRFDYMCKRPSLKSGNSGWRTYPVTYVASLVQGHLRLEVHTKIAYSSTCPSSAALARQIIQNHFADSFQFRDTLSKEEVYEWIGKETSIIATPHSQRSTATVKVRLEDDSEDFDITEMIDLVESNLKTAVQAAVKREDEQEFARLNGTNLMFCEDAARILQAALSQRQDYIDFYAKFQHFESLHPHDALALVTEGIKGGFSA